MKNFEKLIQKLMAKGFSLSKDPNAAWKIFDDGDGEMYIVFTSKDGEDNYGVFSIADILTDLEAARLWFGEAMFEYWCALDPHDRSLCDESFDEENCGDKKDCDVRHKIETWEDGWQYHLQQMIVLPKDKWVQYWLDNGYEEYAVTEHSLKYGEWQNGGYKTMKVNPHTGREEK